MVELDFFVVVGFHEDEILNYVICWTHGWHDNLELQLSLNRSDSAGRFQNGGKRAQEAV